MHKINNNDIIKENEIKNNKFFAPRITSHWDNWLKEFLGEKYKVVYEAAESWDSNEFSHRREAAKYNGENGREISYKYEHHINNKSGDYYSEWFKFRSEKDLLRIDSESSEKRLDEFRMHQKNLQEFQEKKHNLELRIIEELDNPKGCCDEHRKKFINSGEHGKMIANWKKDVEVLESKIRYEKYWSDKRDNSLRVKHYELIKQNPDNNQSKLFEENQDLKKQLAEVKQELVKISETLKSLKDSLSDENKESLAKKFVEVQKQNDKLVNNSNASDSEIREHVASSENLAKEVKALNVTSQSVSPSTNSPDEKGNSNLLIGGITTLSILTVGFGYYLVKRKKNS